MGHFLSIIGAILGLGFLIFIHELGHYFVARRLGMKVEVFSIGFGRPLFKWERKGVKWQLGWFLFGGYVKIAGTEHVKGQDPYTVPGGFFSKTPWQRIQVAAAGPLVNFFFALFVFTLIWLMGGREMDYAEHTSRVGWVDPTSELYAKGVRPGDVIKSYNEAPLKSAKDHLLVPIMNPDHVQVKGYHVDPETGKKTPFDYTIKPYAHPLFVDAELLTTGITQGANYLIYDPLKFTLDDSLALSSNGEATPQEIMGIQPGDRIVWVDGERIYSLKQLQAILNDEHALLTIDRKGETLLRRVPRVATAELKLPSDVREELIDWQHEAHLVETKLSQLLTIPYNLTPYAVVENPLSYIDKEDEKKFLPDSPMEEPLQTGDRIVAIQGTPVKSSHQLFYQLQEPKVSVIVLRQPPASATETLKEADQAFLNDISNADLQMITASLGTSREVKQSGHLTLLHPITPRKRIDLIQSPEKRAAFLTEVAEKKQQIEKIENRDLRARALEALNAQQNQLILGLIGIRDQKIIYNPNPFQIILEVTEEVWTTLSSLFSGNFSPKWLSGPIGIVQVVQHSWQVSLLETLFWLGVISLNLAYLNLLPIPVLDGGYICLFLVEMLTGRRVKPQTMEKLILPFMLLLIGFFLYITFHDISRLFGVF